MSCAACSARVEKAVSKVKGVTSCSVNLLTNSMGVEGSATDADIFAAVKAAGYGISSADKKTKDKTEAKEVSSIKIRLIASIVLLVGAVLTLGSVLASGSLCAKGIVSHSK